jgi:pilus assembly protein CpaF
MSNWGDTSPPDDGQGSGWNIPQEEDYSEIAHRVHQRLLQELDLATIAKMEHSRAREAVETAARSILPTAAPSLYGEQKELVVQRVVDEAVGLGPLEPLLRDPSISEVMVNAPDEVYYERDGIIYESDAHFHDADHIMRIVDRILAPLGRRVDEASPFVDARLPDGSRVNVIIPPLIPRSPTVTVRKFRPDKYTMEDLVANGTLTQALAELLENCVRLRLNTIISGGTGTGKTTLLNALSSFIPERERIITIEDPVELKLQQRHVISSEARPPNIEGRNEVTQRDLFRNSLRMRPDRIIVGEVRGAEAFDMLQAMNTGHEGSLTTVHANSPRDALWRIENMVLLAGLELPVRAIREQVSSALHLVIHVARFPDGRRRVTRVSEVAGMEGDTVTMQDLFRFDQTEIDQDGRIEGELRPTGIVPTFIERFTQAGINMDTDLLFSPRWA